MAVPTRRPVKSRPRILTASAARMNPREDDSARRRRGQHWQKNALEYTRLVPELNYASRFYSKMLKRLKIYPAIREPNERLTPITEGLPVELLDRIQDPGGGRSNILSQYGRLMFITGEGYLLGRNLDTDDERWSFVWLDEVELLEDGGLRHKPQTNDTPKEYGPSEALAYRLWSPSPELSGEAESPMRGVLDVAEELVILSKAVRATAVSRILNGMIKVPSELSFGADEAGVDDDPEANSFLADLIDHIVGAIENAGSAEAAAPFIAEGAEEYLAALDWIRLHDPASDYLEQGLRKEAVERCAKGLDFPAEYLLSLTDSNHWCQSEDTEILTRDHGWVFQDMLNIGDMVRTLNHQTGEAEWQPVEDIYRAPVVEEPMMSLESRFHSSLSTLNHRWPVLRPRWEDGQKHLVREWTTASEMTQEHNIITAAPTSDLPIGRTYPDDLVEIVAWFLTEGSIRTGGTGLTIAQSHTRNPDRVNRIRGCLERLYGEPTVGRLNGSGYPEWSEKEQENRTSYGGPITVFAFNKTAAAQVFALAPAKIATTEFILSLTSSQLELFIDVMCQGDGQHYKSGRLDVWQKSTLALDAFELALILSGRAVSRRHAHDDGFRVAALPNVTRNPIKAAADRGTATAGVVSYTGTVWCPVTSNQTWLARRNGNIYFTGNTARAITHEMWRSHGAPVAEQFCDDLSEEYLRRALREADYPDWRKVVVAYDDADVVISPDRSDDADRALDRGMLNAEGYRMMKGIDQSLAPSEEEQRVWLAVKMRNPAFLEGTRFEIETPEPVQQGGFEPGPQPSADEPRDAEEGPPDPGPAGVSRQESRAAALHGSAYSSLHRCRELAGARIRTGIRDRSRNSTELAKLDGHKNTEVAAVLGKEALESCGLADPLDLVKTGANSFLAISTEWGIDETQAKALAQMIEVFAAKTLYEPGLPAFPSGFFAQVARATEISSELGEEGVTRRNNRALKQLEEEYPAHMAEMAKG